MKRHQILLLHIATSILALFPFPIHAHKMMYQDLIQLLVQRLGINQFLKLYHILSKKQLTKINVQLVAINV